MSMALTWLRQQHESHQSDECLPWPFAKNWDGYGRIAWRGRAWNAHRAMCIIAYGDPPSRSHHAAHRCGNTSCVNPRHLYWATPTENQIDIGSKRRRLDRARADKIRSRLIEGESQAEVARSFGVSPRMVRLIEANQCWVK